MTNSNEAKITQIVFYIHVIVAVWNRLVFMVMILYDIKASIVGFW